MAGVAMAASSDHMRGDHHHSQFQYSSAVTDSSWPSMPATGVPLYEKARHCPALQPMAARKNATVDYYGDETGISNSGRAAIGPGQVELADVLRCILDEQQAGKPRNYYITGLPDNCIDSVIAATLPSDTKGFSNIGINVIDSSDRHEPHALDANALPQASPHAQACLTEYDVASSGSFADTLSVIDTHLKVHAPEVNATIKCPHDCSTMACSSNSCSMCDCFPSNSASTSNILQGYDDHQQLESIDVDASCAAILTASSAHDSFDDYSLCTINGGAALGCSEFSQSKMGASPLDEANAAAAMDALQHVLHDHGRNACMQQDQQMHVRQQSVDETAVGEMPECILYTDNIVGSGPQQECTMVPVCHEETVYPLSGSQMKLMQREATYAAAAVQPVDWASILHVGAGARPKRRNVRISQDPQTVSARRRRERISDRIRVLQRMVPGGMKLDTASMLDEAIHYLKYLKSQVQALEWLEKRSSSSSAADNVSNSSSFSPYSGWYSSFIQSSANTPLIQMIK